MFEAIKSIFSKEEPVNFSELHKNGASIIDVRTPGEFSMGHIKGSKNIPLQNLHNQLKKINKNKPVIVCCASGARSSSARRLLKNEGFEEVHNGGGWQHLQSKLA